MPIMNMYDMWGQGVDREGAEFIGNKQTNKQTYSLTYSALY